jgi:hypothetical protein
MNPAAQTGNQLERPTKPQRRETRREVLPDRILSTAMVQIVRKPRSISEYERSAVGAPPRCVSRASEVKHAFRTFAQRTQSFRRRHSVRHQGLCARWGMLTWLIFWACAEAPSARAVDGYYLGRCDDGRAIQFALAGASNQPTVQVHLEGAGPASLEFRTNRPNLLEFARGTEETRCALTAFCLRQGNADPLRGSVLASNQSRATSFSVSRVAEPATYSRKRGMHLFGRGGGKEFTATWPEFRDHSPFHEEISKLLAAEARGETGQFIAGAHEVVWEGVKGGGASYNWEGWLETEVAWLGTNLVSLAQLRYEFTGGAHGNSSTSGRNFVFADGKAREFALKDLFSGTNWVAALSQSCISELGLQKASLVLDDTPPQARVKGFTVAEMGAFTVDDYGISIHFDPYAVGCYAEGMFHVVIPWSKLEPYLAPEGPASKLMRKASARH